MPTDSRTSAGETSSGELATEPWVITAGISHQRFDAAERLGQGEDARASQKRRARSSGERPSRAAGYEADHAAAEAHLARGQRRLRMCVAAVAQAG